MTFGRHHATSLLCLAPLLGLPLLWLGLVQDDFARHQRLLANTLYLALSTCAISLPLGTLAALLIVRTDLPGRRVTGLLLGAMLFVPLYLQAAAWGAGFSATGWYTLTRQTMDQPLLAGWEAVIWIHSLAAVPWVMVIVGGGLWTIERELDEAALLESGPLRAFLVVTVPRLLPTWLIAAFWVCLMTSAEMTVADLYRVNTYAQEVYILFATEENRNEIIRQTAPGMLVVGWLGIGLIGVASRAGVGDHVDSVGERLCFRVRGWRVFLAGLLVTLVLLVAGVPLLNLVYQAGYVTQRVDQQLLQEWSFSYFASGVVGGVPRFWNELRTTALLGLLAATTAALIAAPLAWWARGGGIRGLPALLIALVCAAVPGPLIGVFVIVLMDRPESDLLIWLYDRTIVPAAGALLIRALPLCLLLSWLSLRTVPRDTVDSAAVAGASAIRRFTSIGIGQRVLPLTAAWLATYAYAIGDLAASILVIPPDMSTVPIRVFGLIHSGVRQDEAVLCLISLGQFAVFAALVGGLLWRNSRTPV